MACGRNGDSGCSGRAPDLHGAHGHTAVRPHGECDAVVGSGRAPGGGVAAGTGAVGGSGTNGVRTIILSALVTNALLAGDAITVVHPSVDARAMSVSEFSGVSILDQTATATGN